ncbi:MAG: xanthine dehydrogenase family protein subunit M [Vulcanimicrobiota bacterium]
MLKDLEEVYFPENLADAIQKRKEYARAAAVIAGGTDIVTDPPPGIRCLIDITRLGLDRIRETTDHICLGATITMQQLATSPQATSLGGGLLARSSCEGWPTPVRNAATLGGNLAGAGPFADTPPALLALDAQAVVFDEAGEGVIPVEEFFVDYRTTAVGDGILTEVRVPKTPANARGVFVKLAPTPVDQALVNLAVYIEFEDGCCRVARIAIGAVTRTPRRVPEAEEVLRAQPLERRVIQRAETVLTEAVEPILDMRASADYRRRMSGVLVRRALTMLAPAS